MSSKLLFYLVFVVFIPLIWATVESTNLTAATAATTNATLVARTVGGTKTTIQAIGGYLVALRNNGHFICGGSYISELYVVTAAHCIPTQGTKKLTVEGGITSLKEYAKRVPVVQASIPRTFSLDTVHNDVAVLKLKHGIIGKSVNYIKLCTQSFKPGDKVVVSGWGFLNENDKLPTNVVRSVQVPIVSTDDCQRRYASELKLTKSMLCAGELGKKDACTFDSGGPLVFRGELCGIVSYGIGCAHKVYPGVYTDIKYVIPFIKRTINNFN